MKEEEFWQHFGKRLQRLMPREEFCEKDAHLNNIKAELLKVKTRRDFEEILKKSRENTGRKFENALKKFVQLTMKKVNEEFAGGRATTMDQLRENIDAFAPSVCLSEAALRAVDEVHERCRDPSIQSDER